MFRPAQKSIGKAVMLLLSLVFAHLSFFSSDAAEILEPTMHFFYNSPLHPTVYQVVKGSLTGIQKVFEDHNHDTIAKGEEFTVVVDYSSPLYNKEREWYEIAARFCYGKDIEGCVNQSRSFSSPYLVLPASSVETPVPFVIPFSKLHNVTLPDGKTVYEAGTVHKLFKTFELNGAKYDSSTGVLVSFSAESPSKAGKISGIDFLRERGKVLKNQPLVQCYFVEWTRDGCVPGLGNVMRGYDVKFMQQKGRRWLKAKKFPKLRDDKHLQTISIQGTEEKEYLVLHDMLLEKISPNAKPFSYLFASVEEQVNTTLKSVGLGYTKGQFLASGKYQIFSTHYEKRSYSAAMSGIEFRLFRTTISKTYLEDEANWDDDFKKKLKAMLDGRDKETAKYFFREYGTHYVMQAVMGGRQETVFTVNYCEVSNEKKSKLEFEATLIKPYKSSSSQVDIQAYYTYVKSHSLSKTIISGPQTTRIGGNSLDSEVSKNITIWKSTILANPSPIEMTLKPFYTVAKGEDDRRWMEKMYQEYLKADLDEVEINSKIKTKVTCERGQNSGDTARSLSLWAIVGISVGSAVFLI